MKSTTSTLPGINVPMNETAKAYNIRLNEQKLSDDPRLQTAARGLQKLDDHFDRVNQERDKIFENSTLSHLGMKSALAEFVQRYEPNFLADVETVGNLMRERIEGFSERMDADISKYKNERLSDRILQHVAGIGEKGKRYSFIKQRVDKEDWESCEAIFNAKAFLVGLHEEEYAMLSDYHKQKRFPEFAEKSVVYEKMAESVEIRFDRWKKLKKALGI